MFEIYKKVSEVKFFNFFGIFFDSWFIRRELYRDYVIVIRIFRY